MDPPGSNIARPWACPCDPTLCCWCRAGDKTEQDLGRELLEPLQKKARTLPELWALKLQNLQKRQEAQQKVQEAQQIYWAQLMEAQQKVYDTDRLIPAVVDPDRLDRAASYHLRAFQAAYGKDMVKPKHHQELHVSDNARKMEECVIVSLKHVEKQHKGDKHPAT